MMRLIRYLLPPEPECDSCNHKSFCDEGIPNCATYSKMRKSNPALPVMSFGPRMKKYSRPVFDPIPGGVVAAPGWQYLLAIALFIVFISFLGAVK